MTITIIKPTTGKNKDRTVITMDEPVSIVVTIGFPNPAVETDDVKRVAPVALLMVAAVPPPAIMAKAQVTTGLKSATVETITAVPAIVARGIAIVSIKLSTKGM